MWFGVSNTGLRSNNPLDGLTKLFYTQLWFISENRVDHGQNKERTLGQSPGETRWKLPLSFPRGVLQTALLPPRIDAHVVLPIKEVHPSLGGLGFY